MTLDKARALLKVQASFGGFYNANGSKLILADVFREHGQEAVDQLIRGNRAALETYLGVADGARRSGDARQ